MITNFFIRCSGACREILKDCPTEKTKYVGIGATVFFTAVLASISGGYAIYFTFSDLWAAVAFGMLWGLVIFNLDRYIVSSIRKTGKRKEEFFTALPRFLIALVLALTISKPLEVKLFDGSITSTMGEWERSANKKTSGDFNGQRDELDNTKAALLSELDEKRTSIYNNDPVYKDLQSQQKDKTDAIRAANQQVGANIKIIDQNSWLVDKVINASTGKTIKVMTRNSLAVSKITENKRLNGDIASLKKMGQSLADSVQSRKEDLASQVKQLELQYSAQVAGVQKQIDDLNSSRPAIIEKARQQAAGNKDILARLRALSSLKTFGNSVWWASALLTALFILLECAPVIVKLLSKRGPYDEILERLEYEIFLDQQKIISDRNDALNNFLSETKEINRLKGESRLKTEKAKLNADQKANEKILEDISTKQADLAERMMEKWYQDELSKIK